MHLEGEGIGTDLFSYTSIPCIEPSLNLKTILVDCPGFEDLSGVEQEKLNIFSIKKIFENYGNKENKFKIILVISCEEFKAERGAKMISSFSMLNKMFTINEKLKNNLGVIVTKTEPDFSGFDYLYELNHTLKKMDEEKRKTLPNCLFDICEFLVNNPKHIFTFPHPSYKQKGQQYDFEDHENVLKFLNADSYLINPEIKIALSNEANLQLNILRKEHTEKLINAINTLCEKVINQISKETNSNDITKWYNIVIDLSKENIKNSDNLKKFLIERIPNGEQLYDDDIKKIAEYELFDDFIDSILYSEIETSCLNEVIKAWCIKTRDYLHQFYINVVKGENQEQIIKLAEEKNNELKEAIDKMREEEEKKIQEYKGEIQILLDDNKNNADLLEKLTQKLQSMEEQLKEKNDNINRIQRELQESKSRSTPETKTQVIYRTKEVPTPNQSRGGFCLLI